MKKHQQGVRAPGQEVDPVWTDIDFDYPLLQDNPDNIYQDLFMASSADPFPADLADFKKALHSSHNLIQSFHTVAAERKVYAAVAYRYLVEDLLEKAMELNEVLKENKYFSMTEAERLQLQKFCEDYLLKAGEMLATSDQLLLEVAYNKPSLETSAQERIRFERKSFANTIVSDY